MYEALDGLFAFLWQILSSATFWMAAATIAIAVATSVNVILFRNYNRVNVAIQFMAYHTSRLNALGKEYEKLNQRAEKGEKADALKAIAESMEKECLRDLTLVNRMIHRLGGRKLHKDMTNVLAEVLKESGYKIEREPTTK